MRRNENPCEILAAAARHLLETDGTDIVFIDGSAVQITARVMSAEELQKAAKQILEPGHDRTTD